MSKDIEITYDSMLEKQMLSSSDFRNHLEKIGFTVVGAAVPHSGVDTGALMQSMGHRVHPRNTQPCHPLNFYLIQKRVMLLDRHGPVSDQILLSMCFYFLP